MKLRILLVTLWTASSQPTMAACLASPEQKKTIVVESCKAVIPAEDPLISRVMGNMPDERNKERIESTYTGLLLQAGGSKYFINNSIATSCSTFSPKQALDVTIERACCDGDPNAPCMLGTSEYISEYAHKL